MQVGRFQDDDAIAVNELISRSLQGQAPLHVVRPQRLIENSRLGLVLVAVDGDRIVGTGTLIGRWVYNVFVEPTDWRRGIGSQIMNALQLHAQGFHAPAIGLHSNLSAVGFYEGLGFRCHNSDQAKVEMYKELTGTATTHC